MGGSIPARVSTRRVPPNLFGAPFGVAGLSEVWRAAVPVLGTSRAIPNAVCIVSSKLRSSATT